MLTATDQILPAITRYELLRESGCILTAMAVYPSVTTPNNSTPLDTTRHNATQHSTAQRNNDDASHRIASQRNTTWHDTTQTTQHDTTQRQSSYSTTTKMVTTIVDCLLKTNRRGDQRWSTTDVPQAQRDILLCVCQMEAPWLNCTLPLHQVIFLISKPVKVFCRVVYRISTRSVLHYNNSKY